MEMAVSHVGDRWFGLVRIEDRIFKVTLWPGSATKEWEALLTETTFVELTPGGKIEKAISLEWRKWKLGEQLPEDDYRKMLMVINEHPEMLEEIEKALNKKVKDEQRIEEREFDLPENSSR